MNGARFIGLIAGGLIAGVSMSGAALGEPVREGTGERRSALDAMELKPFDQSLWGSLAGWTSEPVTTESTQGKVVLICTWASWYPASVQKGVVIAQKLAEKHGAQGLVVVGVHHERGWDGAAAIAKDKSLTIPLAHDAAGGLHRALIVDQDPDFYIVDRAGQLRYADVETGSVESAIAELLGESVEQAGGTNDRLAAARRDAETAARRTDAIRGQIDLSDVPPIPPGFSQPTPDKFRNLDWPTLSEEKKRELGWNTNNFGSGEDVDDDHPLSIDGLMWTFSPGGKPESKGRVVVVYPFNPDFPPSYAHVNQMDQLQRQLGRDGVVVGAYVTLAEIRKDQSGSQPQEADPQEEIKKAQAYIKGRNFEHSLAADFNGTVMGSLGQNPTLRTPAAMIVSSDGVIRWAGGFREAEFKGALDRVLAIDPGVKARRAADAAFIGARGK